jgi:hypothetical protein
MIKKDIDLNQVLNTLQDFPIIMELIGKDWFLSKLKEKSKHPFIYYLSKGRPNYSKIESLQKQLKEIKDKPDEASIMLIIYELQYHYFVLSHLEQCLKDLKGESRIRRILNHLKNEEDFWRGYSEAEIAALLKKKFGEIELEPQLPNRKYTDVKFKINDKWIFAEVTTPEKGQRFSEIMKKAIAAKEAVKLPSSVDRVRTKISEEYDHFRNIIDGVPVILFINTNQCEYDELDIEDALMGNPNFVILTNKKTGEVREYWERDSWTVFDEDKKVELLGGIVSYQRNFTIAGKVVFDVKIFAISFSKDDIEPFLSLFHT